MRLEVRFKLYLQTIGKKVSFPIRPIDFQAPVVQSIVSLMSLLVVKLLTVLVSTISNSQVFLLKNAKATHIFFSKNISIYAMFNDQSFNDILTDDIISFEQLGPEV